MHSGCEQIQSSYQQNKPFRSFAVFRGMRSNGLGIGGHEGREGSTTRIRHLQDAVGEGDDEIQLCHGFIVFTLEFNEKRLLESSQER